MSQKYISRTEIKGLFSFFALKVLPCTFHAHTFHAHLLPFLIFILAHFFCASLSCLRKVFTHIPLRQTKVSRAPPPLRFRRPPLLSPSFPSLA